MDTNLTETNSPSGPVAADEQASPAGGVQAADFDPTAEVDLAPGAGSATPSPIADNGIPAYATEQPQPPEPMDANADISADTVLIPIPTISFAPGQAAGAAGLVAGDVGANSAPSHPPEKAPRISLFGGLRRLWRKSGNAPKTASNQAAHSNAATGTDAAAPSAAAGSQAATQRKFSLKAALAAPVSGAYWTLDRLLMISNWPLSFFGDTTRGLVAASCGVTIATSIAAAMVLPRFCAPLDVAARIERAKAEALEAKTQAAQAETAVESAAGADAAAANETSGHH